ncbi:hypothetical protein CMI37_28685 [Candidatus Pacearchaeota archaeon]|nr:hypothetical protein [Candidatus Pacearchaeota archaeon]
MLAAQAAGVVGAASLSSPQGGVGALPLLAAQAAGVVPVPAAALVGAASLSSPQGGVGALPFHHEAWPSEVADEPKLGIEPAARGASTHIRRYRPKPPCERVKAVSRGELTAEVVRKGGRRQHSRPQGGAKVAQIPVVRRGELSIEILLL